ncbi:MAG: class I SAM-dependent RNA methyltransferase [Thermaurantimonas sp.]|uniref:THUMP domain-containing class I SAM-dependent RNA methyltransferase n=1 Tax=Thermaurantimonas sp. TaxID=2681568 RepID=UPI00391C0DF6
MYTLLVKTLTGFENLLADDIRSLGGEVLSVQKRSVLCKGDCKLIVDVNVCCGVALYVYVLIDEFSAGSKEEYVRKSSKIPFQNYLKTNQTFAVKSDVYQCPWIDNSMYASLLLKDAIADVQRIASGSRSNVDVENPDIEFYQYIYRDSVSIYINTSGEPLYKRGYKSLSAKAPVNEVLAHGIIRLSGYDGNLPFINPFCGSGTFLSEALLYKKNSCINRFRKDFSFLKFHWDSFKDHWKKAMVTTSEESMECKTVFYAIDNDTSAIENARKSIEKIVGHSKVYVEKADFFTWKNPVDKAFLMMNVPYNQRLKIDPKAFFSKLGETLKKNYPGSECWILSAGKEHTKHLGLKSSQTIPLYNGQLPVFLQQFHIY